MVRQLVLLDTANNSDMTMLLLCAFKVWLSNPFFLVLLLLTLVGSGAELYRWVYGGEGERVGK
jgi:hypothetical protein